LTIRTCAAPVRVDTFASVRTRAPSEPAAPYSAIDVSVAALSVGVVVSSVAPGVAAASTVIVRAPAATGW